MSSVSSSSAEILNSSANLLNIACANARSLVDKIDSLITLFDENELHIALLTETWLAPKHCPPRVMSDLTIGANLNFIRRDRGSRGGGVAICYNPTKIRMTKFNFHNPSPRTEIVCATGNCSATKRKIAAISIYLPPNLTAGELATAIQTLSDCVDQIVTKFADVLIVVGGDFNNKDLSAFTTVHASIKPVNAGATRRGASLDEIYTNMCERIEQKCIQKPLSKPDGTQSDHDIIAVSFKLPKYPKSSSSTFSFRPITAEGMEKFSALLVPYD